MSQIKFMTTMDFKKTASEHQSNGINVLKRCPLQDREGYELLTSNETSTLIASAVTPKNAKGLQYALFQVAGKVDNINFTSDQNNGLIISYDDCAIIKPSTRYTFDIIEGRLKRFKLAVVETPEMLELRIKAEKEAKKLSKKLAETTINS